MDGRTPLGCMKEARPADGTGLLRAGMKVGQSF